MIKLKISKLKNKVKPYFLYIFILICSFILLLAYNSCGDSKFSSSSSKTDAISKIETHTVSILKKEIDFIFVVETSLATAQTDYAEKLNKFLEFITNGVDINSRVGINTLGQFRNGSTLEFELTHRGIYLFPSERDNRYSHYDYVESTGNPPTEMSSPPLGPNPLKVAFSLLSSRQIAMDRDQIGSSGRREHNDELEHVLSERGIIEITRPNNIPLEIIVISAISIGPLNLNFDVSSISETIITWVEARLNHTNFKMSAITTTGTHCIDDNINIASDENGSSSRLLQEVAKDVSRNENPVIIDICSDQSNYDRQLGAILRPHGITYPTTKKTSFNLHHTPAQEFPITIKKRSGDSWIELSDDVNYSIEFTDGNTLFVLTQPQQDLLPPGEYQIHYTAK